MRILFIAEAVTLAHVGRMISLAEGLDAARYDSTLAFDSRYATAAGQTSVPMRHIRTIPAEQFFNALAGGSPIYGWRDLVQYVEDDRALIRSCRPDVVVGDFRLSLVASAQLERVPYVTVTNAYWSPYARIDYPVPDLPLTRICGVPIAQALFDLSRPIAFAVHAAPVNRMLRHFQLAPLRRDLRDAYTHADITVYSDIPELIPTADLPDHHQFIGPVQWSPQIPLPDWLASFPRTRPLIYVNLGSSGPAELLPELLRALEVLPVNVIAATAGRVRVAAPSNGFVVDLIPGHAAAALAAVVIGNGGSPSCYQALAAGTPVVGVPTNLDQFLNMSRVERSGAGVLIRHGRQTPDGVAAAVTTILSQPSYAERATWLQSAIRRYSPADRFAAILERLTPGRARAAARHDAEPRSSAAIGRPSVPRTNHTSEMES